MNSNCQSGLFLVQVEEDDFHIKSDAIFRIGKQLNIPFWLLSTLLLPLPHFVRDTVYDQVSHAMLLEVAI